MLMEPFDSTREIKTIEATNLQRDSRFYASDSHSPPCYPTISCCWCFQLVLMHQPTADAFPHTTTSSFLPIFTGTLTKGQLNIVMSYSDQP